MTQLDLLSGVSFVDWTPREQGEAAAERCVAKAERVAAFDREGAGAFIHNWLVCHGAMSGELATDAAKAYGFRPHDDRAFGAVFGALSKRKLIRAIGYTERAKGHGTGGARIWEAAA